MLKLLILLNVFFVSFTDKPEKSAPALSERAIEQRTKWKIATDELDFPVCTMYVDSLRRAGAKVYHTSRWFNGATVEMSDELSKKVEEWKFVTKVEITRDDSPPGDFYIRRRQRAALENSNETDATQALLSDKQLALYNLLPLHEMGYHGQGILMTICDGGFYNADKLSYFRHEQELGHFDFTDDVDDFYGSTGTHGTNCLSTVTGITDQYRGAATQANYYLMRSEEDATESPKEMDNLVAALEKADSLGTNVFSVSLGYAYFDNDSWTLPYSALNGKATRVSRAATIAARKGMLVCVAAGNEGDDEWHTISTPADADSILTVGAVNVDGVIGSFSSFGPSYDGRIKPEVCAVGWKAAVISLSGGVTYGNGTSYATPLIAGLAASLWSALPNENAMQIRERIIRSADRYSNPDTDQYGYGIPDAYAAYLDATTSIVYPTSTPSIKYIENNTLYIYRGGKTYTIFGTRAK